jgi:hypothetical protein
MVFSAGIKKLGHKNESQLLLFKNVVYNCILRVSNGVSRDVGRDEVEFLRSDDDRRRTDLD